MTSILSAELCLSNGSVDDTYNGIIFSGVAGLDVPISNAADAEKKFCHKGIPSSFQI
jgi:hypothetical protein